MKHDRGTLRLAWLAIFGVLAVSAAGCFNPFDPLVSEQRAASIPAPVPNTEVNVVKLFEWCWNNRGIKEYEEIFTDDYRFLFALGDSAGNAYREVPWTREDELRSTEALFVGTPDVAKASEIELSLTSLKPQSDGRPGKEKRWHKSIRAKVDLKVTIDKGSGPDASIVSGFALFYLVRGDSAAIPPELAARGFEPDSNRWWIERWEDETLPPGSSAVSPVAEPMGTGPIAGRPASAAGPSAVQILQTTFGRVKLKGF